MSPEVQAWIEDQKPQLVTAAEEYVKSSGIYTPSTAKPGDGEPMVSSAQLRNLLNVAIAERSLKVLVNFLRYQIGRGGRGWEDKKSGNELETFLTSKVAVLCSDDEASRLGVPRRELEASLAALFLGYVLREYKYVCGGREKRSHG